MADGMERKTSGNMILGFVLGALVVGLAVLGYVYYQHSHRDVVRIDVPGFSGEISKGKDGVEVNLNKP